MRQQLEVPNRHETKAHHDTVVVQTPSGQQRVAIVEVHVTSTNRPPRDSAAAAIGHETRRRLAITNRLVTSRHLDSEAAALVLAIRALIVSPRRPLDAHQETPTRQHLVLTPLGLEIPAALVITSQLVATLSDHVLTLAIARRQETTPPPHASAAVDRGLVTQVPIMQLPATIVEPRRTLAATRRHRDSQRAVELVTRAALVTTNRCETRPHRVSALMIVRRLVIVRRLESRHRLVSAAAVEQTPIVRQLQEPETRHLHDLARALNHAIARQCGTRARLDWVAAARRHAIGYRPATTRRQRRQCATRSQAAANFRLTSTLRRIVIVHCRRDTRLTLNLTI